MSRHVTFRHNELISSVRVSIRWRTKMFKAKSTGIQIFLKPLTETARSWNRSPQLLKAPSTHGPKFEAFFKMGVINTCILLLNIEEDNGRRLINSQYVWESTDLAQKNRIFNWFAVTVTSKIICLWVLGHESGHFWNRIFFLSTDSYGCSLQVLWSAF